MDYRNSRIIRVLILLIAVFSLPSCTGRSLPYPAVEKLELLHFYSINAIPNLQPSGLTIWQGYLYSISDKHDTVIYRINIENDLAFFEPYISFDTDPPFTNDRLDFEGLTCDAQGNFYLVSETQYQILKVDHQTQKAEWIGPNLKDAGAKKGLFRTRNASLEGICWLGAESFILCAERQPRGILEVFLSTKPEKITAYRLDQTRFKLPAGRIPDFSDICYYNKKLYVLQRNADIISTLDMQNGFTEDKGYSFAHLFENIQFQYTDMRFGLAEGLAIDEQYIYIVLDNNDDPRLENPTDRRSWLFVLKNMF